MNTFDFVVATIGVITAVALLMALRVFIERWANALVSTDDYSAKGNIADGEDASEITLDIPWQAPVFGTMAPGELYATMMRPTAPMVHVVSEGRQGAAE